MIRFLVSAALLALVCIEASAEVPEPGTLMVLGICLLGVFLTRLPASE